MDAGRFERSRPRFWAWLATPLVLMLIALLFSGIHLDRARRALAERKALLETVAPLDERFRAVNGVLNTVLAAAARGPEAIDETTRRINEAAQRAGFSIRSLEVDKATGQVGVLRTLKISVRGEGPLPSVIKWLDELQRPGQLLRVDTGRLTSLSLPPDNTVSGEFTLVLYLRAT